MKKTPRWRDKLRILTAHSGWRPEELGGYQAPLPVDREAYQKYDSHVDDRLQIYVLLQFLVVLFGLLAFMMNYYRLSWGYRFSFLIIILLSIVICGAMLEQKKWTGKVEYLRLGGILISLNTLYYVQFSDWFAIMVSVSVSLTLLSALYFTWSWKSSVKLD